MTDGEARKPVQYLDFQEVRVPIWESVQLPVRCEDTEGDEEKEKEEGSAGNPNAESTGSGGSSGRDPAPDLVMDDKEQPPYPGLAPVVFFCIKQTTRPRSWCLRLVCNPWFERVSMLVILLNCATLGLYQPCEDIRCESEWCSILQAFDDFIFAFFAVEMVVKMLALGIFGPKCYLSDTWNRLDFFIVMAGMMEYSLDGHNSSLSAIRTVRVLRPLRAINRVPSMRILVTLLLDTLPMLGNVLLLCFFVFFIFGIVGVQLWAGLLRNRCFLEDDFRRTYNLSFLSPYYKHEDGEDNPFICSSPRDNGMLHCRSVPPFKEGRTECQLGVASANHTDEGCVNWNQYYRLCRPGELNPHKGAINFDNIGYAWIAIFQVITLEGWVDIMYYVMDAHSFYNFIYFMLLIIVGSFFMINLCLVVIATQFSETKQRENQLMREQRARFLSNDSTLASYSEPGSCYEELLKYLGHLYRKVKRRALRVYGNWQSKRRKKVNPNASRGGTGGGRRRARAASGDRRWTRANHQRHYHFSNGSPTHSQGTYETSERRGFSQASPRPWRPGPGHTSYINGGINYPTVMSSALSGYISATPRRKGKNPATPALNYSLPDPCDRLHPFAGEQGLHRGAVCLSLQLPAGGTVPTRPRLEAPGCPYCAGTLDTVCDSDSNGSEMEGVALEFPREVRRGRGSWGGRSWPRKKQHSVPRLWEKFQMKLKRVAESKYFNRGIMIAILVNTLSMGIEYHQQPDELTDILEISNIVFTSMFALEMLLKLLAFSLLGYIRNPYNIFDGIIVIISVWEIVGQADGGLSVLRTFRLLRVLKLVRFLPALRRQLVVLMKTMDNVATFCMLLMLFIFIFSILGMHLFGCKFSQRTENGDTIPDRKNFDSLLWAIVTVFQILTQEDWNVVLYNGMASTSPWAALYFVALMTFGNYVLFNLLVAILVEGFQAEGDANRSDAGEEKSSVTCPEDEKQPECQAAEMKTYSLVVGNGHLEGGAGSLPAPAIMHTAATPRSSLGADLMHAACESRRGSGTFVEPGSCDQRSPSSRQGSPCTPWGSGSAWGSRRSSWNSLSRAPSLKRRDPSGERESLLSGVGRRGVDESDEDGEPGAGRGAAGGGPLLHPHPETLDLPELLHGPAGRSSVEMLDRNGRTLHPPHAGLLRPPKENPDSEEDMDDTCGIRLRKTWERYRPWWCVDHMDWSLYIFSPQNRFRGACQRLISHRMFDHVVLVFIFLNCITIALERPDILPRGRERLFLTISNYVFTVIFVAEMTVKVVALGLCVGCGSYLRSSWNVLDGGLVMVSLVDLLASLASASGNRILGILRVLRLLRTLRPLRVISRAPGLKLVVETLITSLRPIGNIVLICCAFFIVFGILGVQLFKGKFYHCEGSDMKNITNKSDCLSANYRWIRRKYNFDNLGQALMTLFVLASKDGWVNIMYDGLDAVAVDQQPVRNHNPWMLLFFISFLLIVSFFVLNMFVGVVVENFHKCRQDQEEEETRRREEKRQRRLERRRRKAQQRPYYADYSPARLYIHTLCTNHYLDIFITIIIGVNVVTMSLEHYRQPQYLEVSLKYCNYFFTVIFILEALLKLIAFGFRRFFKDRWNQLDLGIVLLSIMGITLEEIEINASLPINPTIIRIMRVLRIARVLKLLKMATGMRALLDTVVQALPQVGNLGLLFMLLFFIYAALGVELFGKLECTDDNPCEGLSRHATFENFGMAFLTLFRVSTGDNWNGIMKDTLRECRTEDKHCLSYLPIFSPLYFVTFVLIAQFVLVNVVVAVLMKHLEESNKEMNEDDDMDAEMEAEEERRFSAASDSLDLGPENRPTYMTPRSGSPDQDGGSFQPKEDLLSLQKMSVSRMHSLPNDSYMFRPVRPASAPYPLPEDSPIGRSLHLGSTTSVQSQPCGESFLLQVPGASPQTQCDDGGRPRIQPPPMKAYLGNGKSRRQQEDFRKMMKKDSLEARSFDGLERQSGDSWNIRAPMPDSLTLSLPWMASSGPASPQGSPPPSSRPHKGSMYPRCPVLGQNRVSRRAAIPDGLLPSLKDPTDEEVWHINSSARRRGGCSQPAARSHSLSPCATPAARLPKRGSSTHLAACRTKEKDPKKFSSVDAAGFLAKPSGANEARRHSIEICRFAKNGDADGSVLRLPTHHPWQGSSRGRSVPTRSQTAPRKKKMSPPCISVEPPREAELATVSLVPPPETSTLLRRRTPSSELPPQRGDPTLDLQETLQPAEVASQSENLRRCPGSRGHLSVLQLPDLNARNSVADVSRDSEPLGSSSCSAGREAGVQDGPNVRSDEAGDPALASPARSPLRKRGLIGVAGTRTEDVDDAVA
ncbi:voltage-dependent T-type calcium channel subunit alpha-1H isoform X3 [Paramormyrops kingsleyae]|uniref:voltage-dependent T-type calcium channel subunit alpha-1H isoform X3 n=1 Tax=Paramormyrops kingsleyae TaxID=1676925 RepID=UPI003B973421